MVITPVVLFGLIGCKNSKIKFGIPIHQIKALLMPIEKTPIPAKAPMLVCKKILIADGISKDPPAIPIIVISAEIVRLADKQLKNNFQR